MNNYIVIYVSEDGEVDIHTLSKKDLELKLNEEYWGEAPIYDSREELPSSLQYEAPKLFIIKGDFITPKPVTTVTKFEVE